MVVIPTHYLCSAQPSASCLPNYVRRLVFMVLFLMLVSLPYASAAITSYFGFTRLSGYKGNMTSLQCPPKYVGHSPNDALRGTVHGRKPNVRGLFPQPILVEDIWAISAVQAMSDSRWQEAVPSGLRLCYEVRRRHHRLCWSRTGCHLGGCLNILCCVVLP